MLLHYRFTHTLLTLAYSHHNTNGSGFYLGAESDLARVSAARSMGRRWEVNTDIGYSRNQSLIPGTTVAGVAAGRYDYLFVGGGRTPAIWAIPGRVLELSV